MPTSGPRPGWLRLRGHQALSPASLFGAEAETLLLPPPLPLSLCWSFLVIRSSWVHPDKLVPAHPLSFPRRSFPGAQGGRSG